MLGKIMKLIDGKKTYLVAAFMLVLGIVKIVFDLPYVETLEVFGMTEPNALISAAIATFLGRDLYQKAITVGKKK